MLSSTVQSANICNKENIKYKYDLCFSGKSGFDCRTKLAILHYNTLIDEENAGNRPVIYRKKVFSKAKNDYVTKLVKQPITHRWKMNIVNRIFMKKLDETTTPMEIDENDVDDGGIGDEFDFDVEVDDDILVQQVIDMDLEEDIDIEMELLSIQD